MQSVVYFIIGWIMADIRHRREYNKKHKAKYYKTKCSKCKRPICSQYKIKCFGLKYTKEKNNLCWKCANKI